MVKKELATRSYVAPECRLKDVSFEYNFLTSGYGGVDPVTEENWGDF